MKRLMVLSLIFPALAMASGVVLPTGVVKPAFFDKQGIKLLSYQKGAGGLNVWQVERGATKTVFYTSSDNKVLMSGVLWDAASGSNISDRYITAEMAETKPADITSAGKPDVVASMAIDGVSQLAGIKEGKASKDKTLYIMFDPRCPYCHSVYKRTRQFVAGGGTVKWIPTTVLGDKTNGVKLVAHIMQSRDPVAALAISMANVRESDSASADTVKAVVENESYFFAAFDRNFGGVGAGVPVAFFQTDNGPQMVPGVDDDALLKRIFKDMKK